MANSPWLGKKMSEAHRKKISDGLRGRVCSKETREKIGRANSVSLLGNIPWNKGKKIHFEVWNKGTKGVCKPNSGSFKKGNIGHSMPHSKETVEKMRLNTQKLWREGKFDNRPEHTPETREKIRQTLVKKYNIPFRKYPLGWHNTFREQIRYRDGYECKICGMPEVEHNKKLAVHHIDYNRHNIKEDNLITLCGSCHSKTNHNRDKWIKFFTEGKQYGS
jgi:hypothetical protein